MKKKIIAALLIGADVVAINFSIVLAFFLRFSEEVGLFTSPLVRPYIDVYLQNLITITLIKVIIFYVFGLYKNLWKYASIEELMQIVLTSFVANTGFVSYMFIMQYTLPRSIYILAFILDVFLIGMVRFSIRATRSLRERTPAQVFAQNGKGKKQQKRVLIIGAGQAGAMVVKELKNHEDLHSKPVGFIDDDDSKLGAKINGVPVLGDRYHIRKIVEAKRIDEIIIAIPSSSKKEIREIVEECSKTKCKLKIVPGMFELIDGQVSIKKIRDVEIEDLLGRDPVELDTGEISDYLKNKVVLVTGGGGSIGSELCRQIAAYQPKKLLILDNYENNAYEILNELTRRHKGLDVEAIIATIREKQRMKEIFAQFSPRIVFHAAAHKHVPLMESSPQEAIKNNIFGTKHVAECAHEYGAERFVMISTDKAVNPTNIMGATKRVAEMIIQTMDRISQTEFVAVRFGNVLGSNGSVIPLFKKQIAEGGPVTITHEAITRYFMTIPEAVQLVIQAGAMAKGGEIFILDMGEPVRIMDLARNLIKLSGFEPDVDIPIQITGLRPGEKLYEELLMAEEGLEATKHDKIFIGKPLHTDNKLLQRELEILKELLLNDSSNVKEYIEKMVPTYQRTS